MSRARASPPCRAQTRMWHGRLARPWLLLAAGVFFVSGCAAMPDERRSTFGIRFPPPATGEGPSAVVFVVDGVSRAVFIEMLDGGRLPNLKKYLADRGLFCERCVANVPSITLVNETSLVTGVFSGRHGITGNTWFDRNQLIERDYEQVEEKNLLDGDYRAATIFERLSDRTTMSLFHQAHRGASKFAENWMSAGPPYFFGWYGLVDRIALWRFDIAARVARVQGEFPALVWAYLLAPDMEAYRSGASSDAYRLALEHTDAHIGRILRDLESAGRLERTVLALVSDHGMVDVARHWPIEKFFRDEMGLRVAAEGPWEEKSYEDRLACFDKYDCVLAGSGDRYWAVYLRKPREEDSAAGEQACGPAAPQSPRGGSPDLPRARFDNWLRRPGPEYLRAYPTPAGRADIIARLLAAEAVDLVAWRAGPEKVHAATKRGIVELARDAAQSRAVSCRTLDGDDPLGYVASPASALLNGKPHAPQEWLAATIDTEYPDLVPQLMAYFDAPRAGDLAVFAAPGWDFHKRNKAGHGGLRPGDMLTVMLLAGPGVPHERRSIPVRSVDLAPTLLGLLGRPAPTDVDGRDLVPGK